MGALRCGRADKCAGSRKVVGDVEGLVWLGGGLVWGWGMSCERMGVERVGTLG